MLASLTAPSGDGGPDVTDRMRPDRHTIKRCMTVNALYNPVKQSNSHPNRPYSKCHTVPLALQDDSDRHFCEFLQLNVADNGVRDHLLGVDENGMPIENDLCNLS